ncbi:MAG: serine/threonine protein kinase [Lentisphaeria bacterium]|nr:serine/threonine protein kinase [Lentisphaeria bacterium]
MPRASPGEACALTEVIGWEQTGDLVDPDRPASEADMLLLLLAEENSRRGLGRLRDFRLIAEGGVGLVRHAFDPSLGRHVAVKSLRPEFRGRRGYVERLLREARATAQLEHPGIVPVYDVGIDEEAGVFFSMREVLGLTLREIVDGLRQGDAPTARRYTQARLLSIFVRLCQAIAYAHSRGVIHRDLKPENVVVGDYGEVLILDWGLVRSLGNHDDQDAGPKVEIVPGDRTPANLTLDGAVSGTPKYMSPEQARGENSRVDERSDIFSLGVLLYEMLTWTPPFSGADTKEVLAKVAKAICTAPRKAAPERGISRDLEAVCLRAMAADPAHRYQAVQELVDDLFACQDGRAVSARRAGPGVRLWRFMRRHAGVSITVSTLLTVILLTLAGVGAAAVPPVRQAHGQRQDCAPAPSACPLGGIAPSRSCLRVRTGRRAHLHCAGAVH